MRKGSAEAGQGDDQGCEDLVPARARDAREIVVAISEPHHHAQREREDERGDQSAGKCAGSRRW